MSTERPPLLLTDLLGAKRLEALDAGHGLLQADLDWLQGAALPSHAQRAEQTRPMIVETIALSAEGKAPIALAGCFSLRSSQASAESVTRPAFLYTPWDGLRKFDSVQLLENNIAQTLQDTAQRGQLLRLLSIAQRSELNAATYIIQTRSTIDGDIFQAQLASIEHAQDLNAKTMVQELIKLPSLTSMLNQALSAALPELDPSQARVAFIKPVYLATKSIHVTENIALSDAVLAYFRHQGWPAAHDRALTSPGLPASPHIAQQWGKTIRETAAQLIPKLTDCIGAFWDARGPFHTSRRALLSQLIRDALWATILVEREKKHLTYAQCRELLRLFRSSRRDETLLFIETVRLRDSGSDFVELAGSLMISGQGNYLITPIQGLQKVSSFLGFKDALFHTPEQKEAVENLLSLEERSRLLRYADPQIVGKPVDLPVAESLADAIIAKQLLNLRYALEMSCQGEVDVHALVDKALDIRAYIDKRLLDQQTAGHWGSQPAFYGKLRPSNFIADQMARKAKSYNDVEQAFDALCADLASTTRTSLDNGLRSLLPELTNVFSIGIRAEAELRVRNATLPPLASELIDIVFAHDPQYPDRAHRLGVRGFRPDVYLLKLTCTSAHETVSLSLAHCFLLTERGGLDTPHSGLAIVWTPADGLQAYSSVKIAIQELDRQLLDTRRRFGLLANLAPTQRNPHRRYQLDQCVLIEDNVPLNRMRSFINHFEAEHGYLSTLKVGDWQLAGPALLKSLQALLSKGAPTNLKRAASIARASSLQQKLPAWLGTAPLADQRRHIELLEQYRNSLAEGKDYLDGIEPLRTFVGSKLQALLDARFPGETLDPETILITPNLAVVGPASSLTDFALQHIDVTEKGFQVALTSGHKAPGNLNEAAVRQILSSLDIPTGYKQEISRALSESAADVALRKRRFSQQLPWQLLRYAHARHLQQHLCPKAFDLIHQVLDMPDAVARRAVKGASASIRPLELIKTGGAAAVKALGLYLISSSVDKTGPQVLYAPYHEGHELIEFKNEADVIAALNKPGALQNLLIRRLPEGQQATFKNLFVATLGQLSEITLASNPINSNIFDALYSDNTALLSNMLNAQKQDRHPFDWATVLHLFSAGVNLVEKQFSAKLNFLETLWESYKDFKGSADALQQHDWKTGLYNFVAGATEMVSLGFLNRDDTLGLLDPIEPVSPSPPSPPGPPGWKDIASTAALRTNLQAFEASGVSLANLQKNVADGTYKALANGRLYIPLAGKVYPLAKYKQAWRIVDDCGEGPLLRRSPDGNTWQIEPQRHTLRFGKTGSKLAIAYSDFKAKGSMNIEARGMDEIRRKYPFRANAIVQALETARLYSINALQNLDQFKQQLAPGARLDTLLRSFFGVNRVDDSLISKIEAAIHPICRALADPSWEQQNADRIVVGNLKYLEDRALAFVMEPTAKGRIYLTDFFFEPGLDWYKSAVPDFFNVDAHAQGATLIHEISHQLFDTLDIVYLDAALPFLDLISTGTHIGQAQYDKQKEQQLNGLSLTTPKSELFTQWNSADNTYQGLESLPGAKHTTKEILKIAGAKSMDEAREAFLDPISPDVRIDVILRNADSVTLLICELGRQLDPAPPVDRSR